MFKLNYISTYSFYKINTNNNLPLINLKSFNFFNFFFLNYYINLNLISFYNLIKYKQIWKKCSRLVPVFDTNLFKFTHTSLNLNLNYHLNGSNNLLNFNLKIIKNNKNYFYTFFKLNTNLLKRYYLNYVILNFFNSICNNSTLTHFLLISKTPSLKYFNVFSSSKNILMINNFLI